MTRCRSAVVAAVVLIVSAAVARGQNAPMMPDPKQMSGVPLPVGDLANGTVTVRVVRGAMTNPVPNQPVELVGGGSPLTGTTNEAGRAEFPGLQAGLRVKAVTTVDGVRLESQEFAVPATGGVRIALVAAAGQTAGSPAPAAAPGDVLLGEQSRIVIEVGDEALNVFNVFQVLNRAATPVQPPRPLMFELPEAAQGAGMLEGSTPQGTLAGKQVIVNGPFAAGSTLVQFAYSIPFGDGRVTLDQILPAALDHVAVVVQKVGDMRLESPQIAEHRDMPAAGQTYIAARGPGLKPGDTLSLTISGLPHVPAWPRNLALGLAVVILAAGTFGALRIVKTADARPRRREQLERRRERLFDELTALETEHRREPIDPDRYVARRKDLVAALERVYAEMDEEAAA